MDRFQSKGAGHRDGRRFSSEKRSVRLLRWVGRSRTTAADGPGRRSLPFFILESEGFFRNKDANGARGSWPYLLRTRSYERSKVCHWRPRNGSHVGLFGSICRGKWDAGSRGFRPLWAGGRRCLCACGPRRSFQRIVRRHSIPYASRLGAIALRLEAIDIRFLMLVGYESK